jgi:hypothetical protein
LGQSKIAAIVDFAPDRTQVLLALMLTPSRRKSALTVIKVLLKEDLATHDGGEHKDARQRHKQNGLLHSFVVLDLLEPNLKPMFFTVVTSVPSVPKRLF